MMKVSGLRVVGVQEQFFSLFSVRFWDLKQSSDLFNNNNSV